MSTVISLLNMKGGVGKTTLAVNLAWFMYEKRDFKVLLVDLDPQFNATQYVMDYSAFDSHRKNAGTIADLLIDQPRMDLRLRRLSKNPSHVLHKVRRVGTKHFELLPSELDLAWVVKNPAQMDYKLEKLLQGFRSDYDFIFIDCAPTDSVLTTMALTASDFLLVPVRPDRFSILGVENLRQTVDLFKKNCPDPHGVKNLGIVFTQVMGTSTVEDECMSDIRARAVRERGYVFTAVLRHSRSFIRAVRDQTPIFQTLYAQETSRNAASAIAREMLQRVAALTATE
jgi:chromosome partitioning protein